MWEYRVFDENDILEELPQDLNFFKSNMEQRSDYYYDFNQLRYGLKERLPSEGGSSPKIELKIRLDKSELGVEYWEKVISHPYPDLQNDHLPMYQIEDIITSEAGGNNEYSSDIAYFQENIPDKYSITEVTKRRWEISVEIEENRIEMEYGLIKIAGIDLYSLSLVCENLDILESIIDDWNLDQFQFKGGYPSLVNTINDGTIPKLRIRK